MQSEVWIESNFGVIAALSAVCAFFFALADWTKWRVFQYLPPLIFIYLTPVALTNLRVLPAQSPVYDTIGDFFLPTMLVLLLLKVDVVAAFRVMGGGVFVMLAGTLGVVAGAPLACRLFSGQLGENAWKAYGTLCGSWIGGTGNMAAVSQMIGTGPSEYGLAVLADTLIYIVWLPILLGSKKFADRFGRFTRVHRDRLARMKAAAAEIEHPEEPARYQDLIFLAAIGLLVTWLTRLAAELLPEIPPVVTSDTWTILLVTTSGILLSLTPARRISGSHSLSLALVYLFVAKMGAGARMDQVAQQAVPFLLGAALLITIHGLFCLLAAWLLRVDVHTAAIASAANIGGAASAPIVAAHHDDSLVPASIMMALIGYAVGNYAAYLAAILCRLVS